MKITVEKVTPVIARQWLELSIDNNRNILQSNLKKIAHDMATGKWREGTGEAIKFNKDGKMMDGQHRLRALINTNKTFDFLVVREIANDNINAIDTGIIS